MKKIIIRTLLSIAGLICLMAIAIILLVRFTDGTIGYQGRLIILGYNENTGVWQFFEPRTFGFDGIDGPYVVDNQVYYINKDNKLIVDLLQDSLLSVTVNNAYSDRFDVKIRQSHSPEPSVYPMPSKLIAISDIEGNFNAFSAFLMNNGIVDSNYSWKFGDGTLVLLGDFVDRGNEVTQVLWLIYKLEQEAKVHQGQVHFILGNHEVMNLAGNMKYAREKYKKMTEVIYAPSMETRTIFPTNSELGRWMRTKNAMVKIGDYLFMHGWASPGLMDYSPDPDSANTIIRSLLQDNEVNKGHFLLGDQGPLWFRGMVKETKKYPRITELKLNEILAHFRVKKIVIGHSIVDDVSYDFGGKVIRIDVKHGKDKGSGLTRGLLIENGIEYRIDDRHLTGVPLSQKRIH